MLMSENEVGFKNCHILSEWSIYVNITFQHQIRLQSVAKAGGGGQTPLCFLEQGNMWAMRL